MDWDHLWKAGAKMLSQLNNPKKLLINPPPGPPPIDSNASGTSVELLSVMSFWHLQGLGRARRGPFVYVRARRGLFVYVRSHRCGSTVSIVSPLRRAWGLKDKARERVRKASCQKPNLTRIGTREIHAMSGVAGLVRNADPNH